MKRQLDTSPISPFVEHLAIEFRTVIEGNRLRQAARVSKTFEHPLHSHASDRGIDLDHQAFSGAVIDNRQTTQAALGHQHTDRDALRLRAHHFRCSRSFRAALSSSASASRRLSLAFSCSSSFSRRASDTVIPAYLAFQL